MLHTSRTANSRIFVHAAATATATFVYCMMWIWQGLDLADEGFNLTNQWLIWDFPENYYFTPYWLSDYLGGFWLRIHPSGGLLWARIGWAVTMAACALTSTYLVQLSMPGRVCAFYCFATSVIVQQGTQTLITYNTLPPLLAILFLISYLHALSASGRQERILLTILAGTLLGLGPFTRLPYLLLLFLPTAFIGVHRFVLDKGSTQAYLTHKAISIASSAVAVFAFGCGLAWLQVAGKTEFFETILGRDGIDESHAINDLLRLYLLDGIKASEHFVAFFVVLIFVVVISSRNLPKRMSVFRSLVALVGIGLPLVFAGLWLSRLVWGTFLTWRVLYQTLGVSVLYGLTVSLGLLISSYRRQPSSNKLRICFLIITAVGMQIAAAAGSNVGIGNMVHGLWLGLPLVAWLPIVHMPRKIGHVRIEAGTRRTALRVALGMVSILLFVGIAHRITDPYNDSSRRWDLNTAASTGKLRQIYTTAHRATIVNETLEAIARFAEPGDQIVAYGSIPMIYFASGTVPAFGPPWIIRAGSFLSKKGIELENAGELPSIIISIRDRNWPSGNKSWPIKMMDNELPYSGHFIADFIDRNGYIEAWRNDAFVLHTH